MENLSPAPKQWKAFANAVWAGAFNKRPGSLAKRYLRQAGALPPKVRWYRNLLAQAKALRLPHLDVHEDNIMMRGRVPVMIDP
jgi:streptomycin 6-kinase